MSLKIDLEPGKVVKVKLVKPGFLTQEWDYTVPSAAGTVTKTMVAERYEVSVNRLELDKSTVAPGEAYEIYIGAKNTGNVPTRMGMKTYYPINQSKTSESAGPGAVGSMIADTYTLTAPSTPGTYTIKLETYPVGKAVTGTREITLTVVSPKGTLSVTTSPSSATVKVGTETKTSPCNFTLAPGSHTVTISKPGYDPITDTITITAGATTTKSYTLTRSKITITFVTKKEDGTTLTGVEVWINGAKKGVT